MKKELILGLDIGSSSVRGALFDGSGRMLANTLARDERRLTATRDGGAEINAEKAFRQVVATIGAVLASATGVKDDIVSIAPCSFWHSLMGIDERGKPTTPVYGWADNRSREFVDVLRRRFDETETHNRTGARFHSSFWPAKLFWIRKEQPDVWAKTARWLSFSDYVTERLCGKLVTSVSMASGTGLFDICRCDWDTELPRYLKINQVAFPELTASDQDAFSLLPKWQKRWPLLKDAKWFPPVADGAANNIGSGCVDEKRAALMVGTSGAMRVVYEGDPPKNIPSGLWCYRVDRKRVIVGGALSDGGGLYDWLKRTLLIDLSDAAIGKEMSRRGADAHGLIFLPFLAGERSTGYIENATGAILGLTMAHDAIDILQAAMEAIAYRFADIFDQLKSVFLAMDIVASGGALNSSSVWTQIISDVLGRDLTISTEPEASLRGAVLLALATTGKIEITDTASTAKIRTVSFHPKCSDVYRKARDRHSAVYEQAK